MKYPNCQQFGFTQSRIDEMLALLEFSEKDHDIAEMLHQSVMRSKLDNIVESFYEYLQQHREYTEYFKEGEQLTGMVESQTNYLKTLGVNYHSPDYFESRLQIGVIHNKIGLPPRLYECAYTKLKELITGFLPEMMEENLKIKIIRFLNRIISLDMALALEGFYQTSESYLKLSIEKLEENKVNLETRLHQDTLTGAVERGAILAAISNLLKQYKSGSSKFCIVLCDINNLKNVNQQLGHLAGDLVLKKYIELIQSRLRSQDKLGRYGGAMFMLLLPDTDADGAKRVIANISSYLQQQDVFIRNQKIKLAISYGVSEAQPDDDFQKLLLRLDKSFAENKA
jgi:diguanylate cyclase (GGDEF)-like protein